MSIRTRNEQRKVLQFPTNHSIAVVKDGGLKIDSAVTKNYEQLIQLLAAETEKASKLISLYKNYESAIAELNNHCKLYYAKITGVLQSPLGKNTPDVIMAYINQLSGPVVLEAARIASKKIQTKDSQRIAYFFGVLKNWKQDGVNSPIFKR